MQAFIAQIVMFGGNFAPRDWALCDGQLLPINSYQALFSLLGTTYGGDGRTTFALPELRGRVPMHAGSGSGPGLSPRPLGQKSGQENVILTVQQMPAHNHGMHLGGTAGSPAGNNAFIGSVTGGDTIFNPDAQSGQALNAGAIANTGNSQGHNNLQPYTVVNFIIALQGIYPSRY